VKAEERMDEGQLNRLTAGVPVDAIGRSSTAVSSLIFKSINLHTPSLARTNRKAFDP
jgi:hypothetical protein